VLQFQNELGRLYNKIDVCTKEQLTSIRQALSDAYTSRDTEKGQALQQQGTLPVTFFKLRL
jgi:hypothetical protein